MEIVSKECQFNHFKSFCNTHNSKNEVCENLILANQPIQPLFTTYIFSENPVSREINFAKIGNSTNSTTRCASMCQLEPRQEIFDNEWQINHFNSVCNTHNLKIEFRENLILANQPIQPLFTTYIFVKIRFCEKILLRGLSIQPIQPLDVQVYVGWSLARKQSVKNGNSTISMAFATHTIRKLKFASIYFWRINHSTTVYYIHICENQVWRESVFSSFVISTNSTTRCAGMYWIEPRENLILANQPIQPLFTTYVYVKIRFREKMLLRGLAYQPIQPLDVQVYVGWSLARKQSVKIGHSTI